MKLKLIWDLDGTLARSDIRAHSIVISRFGEEEVMSCYQPQYYTGNQKYTKQYIALFEGALWNNPIIYDECPLDQYALETIKQLKVLGIKQSVHSLSLVPQISEAKKNYVKKHIELPFTTNVGTEKIYPKADIHVEDYPPNLKYSDAKLNIVITRPWNASDEGNFTRVNSLLEIPYVIKEYFKL